MNKVIQVSDLFKIVDGLRDSAIKMADSEPRFITRGENPRWNAAIGIELACNIVLAQLNRMPKLQKISKSRYDIVLPDNRVIGTVYKGSFHNKTAWRIAGDKEHGYKNKQEAMMAVIDPSSNTEEKI